MNRHVTYSKRIVQLVATSSAAGRVRGINACTMHLFAAIDACLMDRAGTKRTTIFTIHNTLYLYSHARWRYSRNIPVSCTHTVLYSHLSFFLTHDTFKSAFLLMTVSTRTDRYSFWRNTVNERDCTQTVTNVADTRNIKKQLVYKGVLHPIFHSIVTSYFLYNTHCRNIKNRKYLKNIMSFRFCTAE